MVMYNEADFRLKLRVCFFVGCLSAASFPQLRDAFARSERKKSVERVIIYRRYIRMSSPACHETRREQMFSEIIVTTTKKRLTKFCETFKKFTALFV